MAVVSAAVPVATMAAAAAGAAAAEPLAIGSFDTFFSYAYNDEPLPSEGQRVNVITMNAPADMYLPADC